MQRRVSKDTVLDIRDCSCKEKPLNNLFVTFLTGKMKRRLSINIGLVDICAELPDQPLYYLHMTILGSQMQESVLSPCVSHGTDNALIMVH